MLKTVDAGVQDREKLLRFLAQRQFSYVDSDDEDDEDDDEENYVEAKLGNLRLDAPVGFNGRWNKRADTCYTWWVAGTLGVRFSLCKPCANDRCSETWTS